MSSSGTSILSFSSEEEVYFKVYNIREELLLVTPYAANVHTFAEDFLDEQFEKLPHFVLDEMTFFRGHMYIKRVKL